MEKWRYDVLKSVILLPKTTIYQCQRYMTKKEQKGYLFCIHIHFFKGKIL